MLVSNCRSGIDPSVGDQDGQEWRIQDYFSYNWTGVYRYPDSKTAKLISNYARHAALNNNCGYSQSNRLSFWNALKSLSGEKDPKNIKTLCDADCSSSTAAIIKAVGYTTGNSKLKNISESLTTFVMRDALLSAGFLEYDGSVSPYAGDIVLNESCHVVIAVADSDYEIEASTVEVSSESGTDLPAGDPIFVETTSDTEIENDTTIVESTPIEISYERKAHICNPSEFSWYVWAMQYLLKEHDYYTVQATGLYDIITGIALVKWQAKNELETDAQCGELTWASLCKGIELNIGSTGYAVKALEYLLRANGYYIGDGEADGIYGTQVYTQVALFKHRNGFGYDGLVTDDVWAELVKEKVEV